MNSRKQWVALLGSSALAVVLAVGASSTFAQTPEAATPTPPAQSVPGESDQRFGARGGIHSSSQALADELGISLEQLEAAMAEAQAARLQEAVEAGRLTQEEADAIASGERGHRFGGRGHLGGEDESLLAEALGISVETLDAAKAQVRADALAAAVADGTLTQEQADLMIAREALRKAIDKEAVQAEALGITVEELEAAREAGESLFDLAAAQGLDETALRDAMTAAYEAAVQEAVANGVITQEQADQLEATPDFGRGRGGRHGGFGGRGTRAPVTPAEADSDL